MNIRRLVMNGAVVTGLSIVGFGCGDEAGPTPPTPRAKADTQALIGGFPAESPTLDAIGVVGYFDIENGKRKDVLLPNCTGTLIGANTVVTAKHCIRSFNGMDPQRRIMVFATGSDAAHLRQWAQVVEALGAPGDTGGYVGLGHDVAVLHLATGISGVQPLKFGSVRDEQVGSDFVSIGYGDRNNSENYGKRLAGSGLLQALRGRTYEALYGSFDAYLAKNASPDLIAKCAGGGAGVGAAGAPALMELADPSAGPVIITAGTGLGSVDPCARLTALRKRFDALLLEDTNELVVKVPSGDAQPCYGDSGGPLVQRNEAGELVTYGVVSGGAGSDRLICDYGTVYASIGPEVHEFVQSAVQWTDPCTDVSVQGRCDGSVARRCSAVNEGPRRVLEFDCADLGLTCSVQADGAAGCTPAPSGT